MKFFEQKISAIRLFMTGCEYHSSRKAFLFSLYNVNGYAPVKLNIKSSDTMTAIYSCADKGPDFGGNDLVITNNAVDSYTICGVSYSLPPGYSESQSATPCSFFADGSSYKFNPTDVEVFYQTTT